MSDSYLSHPVLGSAMIRKYCKDHPKLAPDQVARAMIHGLLKDQLISFASAFIQNVAEDVRREEVRSVERQSEHGEPSSAPTQQISNVTPTSPHQAWYEDPSLLMWTDHDGQFLNTAQRKKFRRWLGDRHDAWYSRGLSIAENISAKCAEIFEEDWSGDPIWQIEAARRDRALRALLMSESERIRLETTRDLLDSIFALGDGVKVTWGAANIEQHRQRVDLLVGNASGNIEAAARHQAAIRMITDAGVSCLEEINKELTA